MGKRKNRRRDQAQSEKTRRSQGSASPQGPGPRPLLPSAQTLFRYSLVDAQTRDLLAKAATAMKPMVWARDEGSVRVIEEATSVEELIDLLPVARGLPEHAWLDKMDRFGNEVLPLCVARMKAARTIADEDRKHSVYELLLAHMRWRGDAGAPAVLEAFSALDDYGKSQACVVLGLLRAKASADTIWSFYQRVKRDRDETHFVGALWGLIDLRDERPCPALLDHLMEGRFFAELFGFLSLAGDSRAVLPLLAVSRLMLDESSTEPLMAVISIAHRIGRQALLAEFDKAASPKNTAEKREAIANLLLAKPLSEVQEYFASFYRGLRPDEMARGLRVLDNLGPG